MAKQPRGTRRPLAGRAGDAPVPPGAGPLMLVGTLVVSAAILAPNLQEYIAQREAISRYQLESAVTQQSIDELTAEKQRWADPAYVQAQARDRLLFIMPGETSYLVTAPPAQRPAPVQPAPVAEQHETQQDWLSTFGESFISSGTVSGDGSAAGGGAVSGGGSPSGGGAVSGGASAPAGGTVGGDVPVPGSTGHAGQPEAEQAP